MMNHTTPKTPREAHHLAYRIGNEAANERMFKAGRTKWTRGDYNLAARVTQEMYRKFNILNAEQWMPSDLCWRKDETGNYRVVPALQLVVGR